MRHYLVVAYDIVSDRRRARLARKLEDFLPRIQKSVFEGWLPARRRAALERLILDEIDLEEDEVRIYHLCGHCRNIVRGYGRCEEGPVGSPTGTDEIIDN